MSMTIFFGPAVVGASLLSLLFENFFKLSSVSCSFTIAIENTHMVFIYIVKSILSYFESPLCEFFTICMALQWSW